MHSGCNGGKKWAALTLKKNVGGEELWATKIIEKFAGHDVVIFNSVSIAQKLWPDCEKDRLNGYFLRPQKVVALFEDWLVEQPTFNYEDHSLYVNSKWFSLNSIGEGLREIGEFFNRPLVEKK